ncbi:unnamed protein product [Cyprideis torosa]|uniref:Uncharacterized protein n=1 Tax=Cyprideis torosa TaxID=163714 RepID=A0A7R8ZJ59_9CRUS|nr:unnamed protein product [Cyprideis torosa]CAG0886178.1 unnamed protein product [Cyprideis torosa]
MALQSQAQQLTIQNIGAQGDNVLQVHLNNMVQHFGRVISVKILRDASGRGTGTGFARMESKDVCEQIISHYNGKFILAGSNKPLVVKFANKSNNGRYRGSCSAAGDPEISPRNLTMAVYLQTTQTPSPYYLPQPTIGRYLTPPPPPRMMHGAQSQAYCIKMANNKYESCCALNANESKPSLLVYVPSSMLLSRT